MLEEEQCCSGAGGVLVVRRRCSRGKIVAEKKRTPVGLWWAYRRNFIWVGENVREKTKWCARVVAEGGGSMGYSYDSNDRDNDEYERCPFCGSRGIDLLISDKGDLKYRAKGRGQIRTPTLYFVGCQRCGGRTADFAEIDEAVDAWNMRASREGP